MMNLLLSVSVALLFLVSPAGSIYADEDEDVSRGQQVFQERGCVACHTIGKGRLAGPDLAGVTKRREEEWLERWIMHPDTMIYTDPIAKELLREYMVPMPNQGVSEEEVEALMSYFKHRDEELGEEEGEEKLGEPEGSPEGSPDEED